MKKSLKLTILFIIGGLVYYGIEYIYKSLISHSPLHWSMFLLGGLCFVLIGAINERFSWDLSIIKQCLIGALIITCLEFIFGIILNVILGLQIWDYSRLPLNIMGQVCLPFSIAWFFLSLVAILLDDFLRWKWFGEEKPHYYLFTNK